jgi:hypothetical protein
MKMHIEDQRTPFETARADETAGRDPGADVVGERAGLDENALRELADFQFQTAPDESEEELEAGCLSCS